MFSFSTARLKRVKVCDLSYNFGQHRLHENNITANEGNRNLSEAARASCRDL